MDMTGRQRIPADRDTVWKALNDVEVLKACIPGCQELSKTSDTAMAATAVIKVGPVSAKFQGSVTLSELDPPNGYRITGEGQGGVAGFAKGGAVIRLEQDGTDTILHYDVSAQVGGKLSQLGGRLIDVTAKQMSNLFFKRFSEEIQSRYGAHGHSTKSLRSPSTPQITAAGPIQASRDFASPTFRTAPRPFSSIWMLGGVFLLIALIGVCWFVFGGFPQVRAGTGASVSADLVSGVILMLVAAVGYLFGRQSGLRLDQDAVDRLARALEHRQNLTTPGAT